MVVVPEATVDDEVVVAVVVVVVVVEVEVTSKVPVPVTAVAPITVAKTVWVPSPASDGTTKEQVNSPPCRLVPVLTPMHEVEGVESSKVKVVTGALSYWKPTPVTLTTVPSGPTEGLRFSLVSGVLLQSEHGAIACTWAGEVAKKKAADSSAKTSRTSARLPKRTIFLACK